MAWKARMMSIQTGTTQPLTENERFKKLQARLTQAFQALAATDAPRTVLIVPSLSLDQEVLARISGAHHYEERMLCYLMLLRLPRTRVIYVSSYPIPESIIDYYQVHPPKDVSPSVVALSQAQLDTLNEPAGLLRRHGTS
jgi:hypothetical protein